MRAKLNIRQADARLCSWQRIGERNQHRVVEHRIPTLQMAQRVRRAAATLSTDRDLGCRDFGDDGAVAVIRHVHVQLMRVVANPVDSRRVGCRAVLVERRALAGGRLRQHQFVVVDEHVRVDASQRRGAINRQIHLFVDR